MNPSDIDIAAAYRYLSLETVAFMVGIVFSYACVVFLVIDKARYMYVFLIAKICSLVNKLFAFSINILSNIKKNFENKLYS